MRRINLNHATLSLELGSLLHVDRIPVNDDVEQHVYHRPTATVKIPFSRILPIIDFLMDDAESTVAGTGQLTQEVKRT